MPPTTRGRLAALTRRAAGRRLRLSGYRRPLLLTLLLSALVSPLAPVLPAAAQEPVASTSVEQSDQPFEPGDTAKVSANGNCLRLRDIPSLSGTEIICIPSGSQLSVLEGQEVADGYRWQRVDYRGKTGWVADAFLVPYVAPAGCTQSSTIRPGLSGSIPVAGGLCLVIWGGGTFRGLEREVALNGCRLGSVWAQGASGALVGYRPGAPEFVNADWFAQFPGERIEAGTVLILICDGPTSGSNAANIAATTAGIPSPAPWGSAPVQVQATQPTGIGARAAVVVDEASGEILWGLDAEAALPPASLTKIATAILAIEGADLDEWVVSDVDSRRMNGSSLMGLLPGDCFPMEDLLEGLLLPSGNDAALAIARYVAGSDAAFVERMNVLASELGLRSTRFIDPHGLGGPGHETSAYDLALLARYAMQLPEFREIVDLEQASAEGARTLSLWNTNRLLGSDPSVDGVKTGFTEAAGRTIVASARRDGHRVFVVVLNSPDRYGDVEKLLDWAFSSYRWQ